MEPLTPLPEPSPPAKHSAKAVALAPHEQRSIDEQIQEVLYRFVESSSGEDAFAAANNANAFSAHFDASFDLDVRPFESHDESGWSWKLSHPEDARPHGKANGNRLTIERGGGVTEWFVNEPRGIEQGFTVERPLPDGKIPMTVTTDLTPELVGGGDAQEIRFNDPATGETHLRYAELFVTDATGDRVPAEMSLAGNNADTGSWEVALHLDDTGARYPITVDPTITSLEAELVDDERLGRDGFGKALAMSGDVIAVSRTSIDHKVFVFERQESGLWAQTAALQPVAPSPVFLFGEAIAIHRDRIVVIARNDPRLANDSEVYVFERNLESGGRAGFKQPVFCQMNRSLLILSGTRLLFGRTRSSLVRRLRDGKEMTRNPRSTFSNSSTARGLRRHASVLTKKSALRSRSRVTPS